MELEVVDAHLVGARTRAVEHACGHVDADDPPGRPGHLGGDEQVRAGAASEVEHDLSGRDTPEHPMVGHAGEAVDGGVGHAPELGFGVAELMGPRAPGGDDELLLLIGRDVGVGLADLLAEDVDVDGDVRGAHDA